MPGSNWLAVRRLEEEEEEEPPVRPVKAIGREGRSPVRRSRTPAEGAPPVFCGLGSHSGADWSAGGCPPFTVPVGGSPDVSTVISTSSAAAEVSSAEPAVERPFDSEGFDDAGASVGSTGSEARAAAAACPPREGSMMVGWNCSSP